MNNLTLISPTPFRNGVIVQPNERRKDLADLCMVNKAGRVCGYISSVNTTTGQMLISSDTSRAYVKSPVECIHLYVKRNLAEIRGLVLAPVS